MFRIITFTLFILLGVFHANAAPQFPFPQNKAYPYGHTYKNANTAKIQSAFETWKGAWYTESNAGGFARIISPNDSAEISVSEGIAYGMLLMVYMSSSQKDYKSEFDKLWGYWKKYAVSANSATGMNWHVNNKTGNVVSGSATDADIDAAVALIMASKQWGQESYLTDAKNLISWMKSNDFMGSKLIRAGSNWDGNFNPSYVSPAAFKLFGQVTNDASYWNDAITVNNNRIKQCQDKETGIMPDWCDGSNKPVTSGAVSTGIRGLNYDAARTPWRMAWGYAWYGDASSKEVNDKFFPWINKVSYGNASYLTSYEYSNSQGKYINLYDLAGAVESVFSGGVGLAAFSADNPGNYVETIYETLINNPSKTAIDGKIGEGYFSATINMLTLLFVTGNMPNLYDISSHQSFTPGTPTMPTPPTGTQNTESSTSFAGFNVWGAFSDKLGTGTLMYPDSGTSPLYIDDNGVSLKASLRIAAEPIYGTQEASDGKYPFAGVMLGFDKNDSYYDLSDVDFIRIRVKTQGVMRLALLSKITLDVGEEGGEPGYWFHPSDDFKTIDIPLTGGSYFDSLMVPPWASEYSGAEYKQSVRGIKFEPKMTKGGYASIEVTELTFLNAAKQPAKIYADLDLDPEHLYTNFDRGNKVSLSVQNGFLRMDGFQGDAKFTILDLNGKVLYSTVVNTDSGVLPLNHLNLSKGVSIVHLQNAKHSAFIKVQQ